MSRKIFGAMIVCFLVLVFAGGNWSVANAVGTVPTKIPTVVIPVTGGTIIASGFGHSCMTVADGRVVCWGLNDAGQLGDGSTSNRRVAVYVKDISGVNVLALGSRHSCALLTDGSVWCWGSNKYGQLGNGSTKNSSVPVQVTGLPAKAVNLTSGENFACAVLDDNTIWCWGENGSGQLNDGTTENKAQPVKSQLTATPSQISGGQSSVAGEASGFVSLWKDQQPLNLLGISNAFNISANRFAKGGCAVITGNKVSCWGEDNTPAEVTGAENALAVGTGLSFACYVDNAGAVHCWGKNGHGELGTGNTTDSEAPASVVALPSTISLAVGASHTCVIVSGNQAMCWGLNTYGQLGNNSTRNSSTPVLVILPGK
jgi:alpha-tubulin suppressor-like RCC1 family protein